MNENHKKVPKRIAQAVLNSLKGGVVPRIGLPYIMVGRKNEVNALLHDVDIITKGGASFRFILADTVQASFFFFFAPGHPKLRHGQRLHRGGRGPIAGAPAPRRPGSRSSHLPGADQQPLHQNKAEGGALTQVLDRWISGVQAKAVAETGSTPGIPP